MTINTGIEITASPSRLWEILLNFEKYPIWNPSIPRIFDGEHSFEIQDLGEYRVRFIHSERFSRILVPLLSSALLRTKAGFEMMNASVKSIAEADHLT